MRSEKPKCSVSTWIHSLAVGGVPSCAALGCSAHYMLPLFVPVVGADAMATSLPRSSSYLERGNGNKRKNCLCDILTKAPGKLWWKKTERRVKKISTWTINDKKRMKKIVNSYNPKIIQIFAWHECFCFSK